MCSGKDVGDLVQENVEQEAQNVDSEITDCSQKSGGRSLKCPGQASLIG